MSKENSSRLCLCGFFALALVPEACRWAEWWKKSSRSRKRTASKGSGDRTRGKRVMPPISFQIYVDARFNSQLRSGNIWTETEVQHWRELLSRIESPIEITDRQWLLLFLFCLIDSLVVYLLRLFNVLCWLDTGNITMSINTFSPHRHNNSPR